MQPTKRRTKACHSGAPSIECHDRNTATGCSQCTYQWRFPQHACQQCREAFSNSAPQPAPLVANRLQTRSIKTAQRAVLATPKWLPHANTTREYPSSSDGHLRPNPARSGPILRPVFRLADAACCRDRINDNVVGCRSTRGRQNEGPDCGRKRWPLATNSLPVQVVFPRRSSL